MKSNASSIMDGLKNLKSGVNNSLYNSFNLFIQHIQQKQTQVVMQVKIKVHHLQIQEKVMTNIVIYLTCQEMHMNGPQNTLPTLSLATSALVFIVEDITTQILA